MLRALGDYALTIVTLTVFGCEVCPYLRGPVPGTTALIFAAAFAAALGLLAALAGPVARWPWRACGPQARRGPAARVAADALGRAVEAPKAAASSGAPAAVMAG